MISYINSIFIIHCYGEVKSSVAPKATMLIHRYELKFAELQNMISDREHYRTFS